MMITLFNQLTEWADIDVAQQKLAIILGLADEKEGSFQVKLKWIYWSENQYGNTLYKILMKLVEIGFLEYNDEEQKIRANPIFKLKVE